MPAYTTGIIKMNGHAVRRITETMTPELYRQRLAVWFRIWRETGTQYQFEYFFKGR